MVNRDPAISKVADRVTSHRRPAVARPIDNRLYVQRHRGQLGKASQCKAQTGRYVRMRDDDTPTIGEGITGRGKTVQQVTIACGLHE